MNLRGRLVAALLLIPPCCVAACGIHDRLLDSNLERVKAGMRSDTLIDVLGKPREALDCKAPGPFRSWRRPDCAKTYLYPSWGAPLVPEVWAVWLNDDGIVIDKYRFVSW